MELTSTIEDIRTLLTEVIADFQTHKNVNILCEEVRNDLFAIVESFLVSAIEKVLCAPELLGELKIGAGKKALRFNGYRPSSIRLLTGTPLSIRSPYFSKAVSKRRPGPKSKKRQKMNLAGEAMPLRGKVSLCDTDRVNGKTVLVCIDGGRLRERRPKRGRKQKGQKRRGYHADWKEPIQFVIQIVNSDGTISKKHLPLYDATMGDIDSAFELLEIYLRELNVTAAERVVFCCDGARSYWKRTGPLAKRLGISIHHEVIDYTHAKQKGAFPFSRSFHRHWIMRVCHLFQAVPTPCFII